MYSWDFSIIWDYRWLLLQGVGVTIAFTIATVVLGLLIGLIAATGSLSRYSLFRGAALTFIEIFRCTPLLVQLIWAYYALPIISGIELSPISAALIALSCYGGSFYAEIIRGGIVSIDTGQSEASSALGMMPFQTMRRIILPQAIRRMVPALMNQAIIQLKNTSLVSILAVPDLVYEGQMIAHDSFRPLEVYTTIAVLYFIILFPLTVLVRRGEKKLGAR